MTKLTADGRLLTEVAIVEMEAGDINIGNVDIASLPALPAGTNVIGGITMGGLTYKGEQTIDANGASQAATLPSGTNMVELSAEGGAIRYSLNGSASATSGGYVPQDQARVIIKSANLTSLAVFGTAPAKAHLLYFQEP